MNLIFVPFSLAVMPVLALPTIAEASWPRSQPTSVESNQENGDLMARRKKRKRKKRRKQKAKQDAPATAIDPKAAPATPKDTGASEPTPAAVREPPALEGTAALESALEPETAGKPSPAAAADLEMAAAATRGAEAEPPAHSSIGLETIEASAVVEAHAIVEARGVDAPSGTLEPTAGLAEAGSQRVEVFPVTLSLELGVGFPQMLSDLRTTFVPRLEVGYLLPFLDQRLEVFAAAAYSFPDYSTVIADSRFTSSDDFRYRIQEQELITGLGVLYRFFPPRTGLNFYGQAGLEVRWQESVVRGNSGGVPLGINGETKTAVGGAVAGGIELLLGPGALAAEIGFALAELDHRVTGEASTGGLALQIGYHLQL